MTAAEVQLLLSWVDGTVIAALVACGCLVALATWDSRRRDA